MRIRFQREGGFGYFPGRRAAAEIDTADLPPEEARDLERLVREADLANRPARVRSRDHDVPDAQSYVIEVEDGDRRHALRIDEPVEDDALEALVAALQRATRRRPTR